MAARWGAIAPLPAPQQETAVLEVGGNVWVLGGLGEGWATLDAIRVLDVAKGTWSDGPRLPRAMHHINAAVVDGRVWIVGGLDGRGFTALGSVWVLDPSSGGGTWLPKAPMPTGSERGASMVASIGKTIYVAGGLRGLAAVTDVSSYDTERDVWTSHAALPAGRDHGVAAAMAGIVYVLGGRGAAIGGHTASVLAFDPASNSWTERAPMPTSRAGTAAAITKGRIVVIGGEGNTKTETGVFAEAEAYDPLTNTWSSLPPMKTPRHGMGAATVHDVVYVPGGGDRQSLAATAVVETLSLE